MDKELCGFCASSTKITKEHVIGKSVGILLGAGKSAMHARNTYEVLGRTPQTVWETRNFDQQVRMACKSCNSGWMANLDNKVLRIISPMILGARTGVLTVEAQVVIATWAVKT